MPELEGIIHVSIFKIEQTMSSNYERSTSKLHVLYVQRIFGNFVILRAKKVWLTQNLHRQNKRLEVG